MFDKNLRCYCISNYWSVYGLRKILLNKYVLILWGKKPNRSNVCKRKTFLISRIHFTYKFIISDTKTKQNKIFVVFEILANILLTLINWLLKPKCMLKHFFAGVWQTQYDFLALRHLAVCTKTFFFLFFKVFCILNKNRVF